MATGRKVTKRPGTFPLRPRDVHVPIGVEPIGGTVEPVLDGEPVVVQQARTERELFLPRIVPLADLGVGEAYRIDFRQTIERLRVVQRTAAAVLAMGYGRVPTDDDFDDLVAGAIYFDFPVPPSRDVTLRNIGGVALAHDLLVIGMRGERYERV